MPWQRTLSLVLSILIIALMMLALLGWLLDIPELSGVWFEGLPPPQPVTLVSLLLTALAIAATHLFKLQQLAAIITLCLGAVVAWIGLHELLLIVTKTDNGYLNQQFLHWLGSPYQDAPTTQISLSMIILGVGLCLLSANSFYTIYASQFLQLLFVMMISIISFSYIYRQQEFLEYTTELGLTFPESVLLLLTSFALMFARPDNGFLKILSGNSSGAVLMRITLPFVLIIPLFFGWLAFLGYREGLYTERFGAAMLESMSVLFTTIVLVVMAHYISYQQSLRKQAERHVLKTQRELAHVVRVHTMGELASGLAHELNQPLAAINLYASTCQRQLDKPDNLQEKLGKNLAAIKEQSHRASEIIKRMRSFLKKQRPEEEAISINKVLDDVLALHKHVLYQTGISVARQSDKHLPPVKGDHIQIAQIFLNLIQNAIDSMRLDVGHKHRLIINSQLDSEKMVRVDVTDTGPGIPAEVLPHLFEAFFSTKEETGLGVGLSISRNIAEHFGGSLKYRPTQLRGATFSVTLPAFVEEPAAHEQA